MSDDSSRDEAVGDDRSILLRLEEQGQVAPRVRLKGTDRSDAATERYEVLGEVARGGVGVVLRGRDNDVGRDVALKVLLEQHLRSPELVQRFVEEAQVGGQLQHPGIVPVYELGLQADNRPFFAMKLVKGETLAVRLAARQDPHADRRALLAVFREVCRTLAYAHSRGVIHRDLKPSNVMIGNFGEVQVVDWGFAKVLQKGGVADERLLRRAERHVTMISTVRSGAGSTASIAGSVMGTPAYMPPEQAMGRVEDLDERSDLFCLGAILCEILTGAPPYGGGASEVMTAAAEARLDAAHARLDACGADQPLVALCKRCLEPLPQDRPASATVLADEVAAHLATAEKRAHEMRLEALRAQEQAEQQRRARRQTTLVGGSVVALLVIAAGAYFLHDAARTRRERDRRGAIEAALQDAERLRSAQRWPEALAAAERAIGLGDGGAVARGIREEAAEATARAKREALEDAFLAELEEIRAQCGEAAVPGDNRGRWSADDAGASGLSFAAPADPSAAHEAAATDAATDAAYQAAFQRRFASVEAAAEVLKGSRHAPEFAANLGFWCWMRKVKLGTQRADWQAIDRVAREVDPGNGDVRDALISGDADALLALAGERGDRVPLALAEQVGLALTELGRAKEALAFLRRQHARAPGDFWIHLRLAYAARKAGDHDLAVRHGMAAVAARPAHAMAWHTLAHARQDGGDLDGAIAAYGKSLALDPSQVHFHLCLALALENKGDLDGAIAAMRTVLERSADKLALRYMFLGQLLEDKGDTEGAVAAVRSAIEADPTSAGAYNQLGLLQTRRLHRHDEAAVSFRMAFEHRPDFGGYLSNLGTALKNAGDSAGALAAHRRAVEVSPDLALAHVGLGNALGEAGDLDGALAAYGRALELEPETAHAYEGIGGALLAKGDLDGAIAASGRAIELDPGLVPPHVNLGRALHRKGDHAGALASFRRHIELEPASAAAQQEFGVALAEAGDPDGALAAFRRAIELDPRQAVSHYSLGVELHRKGDIEGTIAALEKAIELDPAHVHAHRNLANILIERGDPDGAIALLRRAVAFAPEDATTHDAIGVALKEKGDLDGALSAHRRALNLDPRLGSAHLHIGNVLAERDDFDGAIASYREALRLTPESRAGRFNLPYTLALKGQALLRRGAFHDAVAPLREANALAPREAQYLRFLCHVLMESGDLDGALAASGRAALLAPKDAAAYWGAFGNSLRTKGEAARAVAAYRKALEFAPGEAEVWGLLGATLQESGDVDGAVAAWRRAVELAPADPAARRGLARAEERAALGERLPGVLAGTDRPADAQEAVAFAQMAMAKHGDHAAALWLFRLAFESDPGIALDPGSGLRYNAACAAARTGPEHHALALQWLRADLDAWARVPVTDAQTVAKTLAHWKRDADLASLRDGDDLPGEFRKLWADVDALLRRAEGMSK